MWEGAGKTVEFTLITCNSNTHPTDSDCWTTIVISNNIVHKILIICVAPYPGEKQEEKFPGNMDVAQEVIDSYNAGASIAHLHVRDENGIQTTNTELFQKNIERVLAHCPIIIEGSTGGAPKALGV